MDGPWRLGLLGDPVARSLSPAMQEAALRACGLEGSYALLPTPAGGLAARLAELAAAGFHGLNITAPLKEEAYAWLLETGGPAALTVEAAALRAVNTLRRDGSRWRGHDGDAAGFRLAARALAGDIAGQAAVVLGAGGAARAAVYALAQEGAARIAVWNRGAARVERLAADLEPALGGCVLEILAPDLACCPRDAALLVQATSAGLAETDAPPPGPAPGRRPFALELNTRETAWLSACRRAGCPAADGREMLLGQGAEAFRFWTGRAAPLAAMRAALASA